MISMSELLHGAKFEDQCGGVQYALQTLLQRVNVIREAWGKPMTVTSGLRTKEDQIRIYAAKGITDESKIPWNSQHLTGGAIDIYDPDLSITAWLKENDSQLLVDNKLWCEEGNANWVHFQINPPHSGVRWFLP